MSHTVILFEPGKLPRFIQNVTSLRNYRKNPHAVIDPKDLPAEKLIYWQKVSKNKLGYYKSASKRLEIDNKVKEIVNEYRQKKIPQDK